MLIQKVNESGYLSDEEIREVVGKAFQETDVSNKRVLIIIPDSTRTAPMPLMFKLIGEAVGEKVAKLDYLVALGTHPEMPEDKLNDLVGITAEERAGKYAIYRGISRLNKDIN